METFFIDLNAEQYNKIRMACSLENSIPNPTMTDLIDYMVALCCTEADKVIATANDNEQILHALKKWRKDKAMELQQPEFMIFPNAVLQSLAIERPLNNYDLSRTKGMTAAKFARYGDDILAILNAF